MNYELYHLQQMDDFQMLLYIHRFSKIYLKQCFFILEIPENNLYPAGVLTKYLSVFFIFIFILLIYINPLLAFSNIYLFFYHKYLQKYFQ